MSLEYVRSLEDQIKNAERQLKEAEATIKHLRSELESQRQSCEHEWDETRYDPIITEACRTYGDASLVEHGPRYLPPLDVPRQETARWTRKCLFCLKEESTLLADEHTTYIPRF